MTPTSIRPANSSAFVSKWSTVRVILRSWGLVPAVPPVLRGLRRDVEPQQYAGFHDPVAERLQVQGVPALVAPGKNPAVRIHQAVEVFADELGVGNGPAVVGDQDRNLADRIQLVDRLVHHERRDGAIQHVDPIANAAFVSAYDDLANEG